MKRNLAGRMGEVIDAYLSETKGATWEHVLQEIRVLYRVVEEQRREDTSPGRTLH